MAPKDKPKTTEFETGDKVSDQVLTDHVKIMEQNIFRKIDELERTINLRFDRLKQIVSDYLSLGSEMAQGSLITALKQV